LQAFKPTIKKQLGKIKKQNVVVLVVVDDDDNDEGDK
jgi:hypothetical protein